MEKIEYRGTWVRGDFYNATDVDALLADVRRLIEAAKTARTFLINRNLVTIAYRVDMQIAAVERHFKKEALHANSNHSNDQLPNMAIPNNPSRPRTT